jgi:acetyl esterase/lipase
MPDTPNSTVAASTTSLRRGNARGDARSRHADRTHGGPAHNDEVQTRIAAAGSGAAAVQSVQPTRPPDASADPTQSLSTQTIVATDLLVAPSTTAQALGDTARPVAQILTGDAHSDTLQPIPETLPIKGFLSFDADRVEMIAELPASPGAAALNPAPKVPKPPSSGPGSVPTPGLVAGLLAAVARREVNGDSSRLQSAAAVQTISEDATTIAVAPGIVVPPTLAGHYTLTGPPSFVDQVMNFALGILHQISRVIGVELSLVLDKAISSADPPFFTTFGLTATKTTYTFTDDDGVTRSWKVWQISAKHPSGEVVIAIHGSAMTIQPSLIQWLDYAQTVRDTGATVIVPIYPLTQNGGQAAIVAPGMAEFIAIAVAAHGAEHVSIYADSSGGLIAMLAVQKIVRDCAGDSACLAQARPARMVLLSPGLSGKALFTDPNVALVDDPVESVPNPNDGPNWQGDLPDTGAGALLWDPSQGSAADLPAIAIYIGTRDILAPGELTFAERMVEAGSPVTVVIGVGQIHDWALGGLPASSKAPAYRHEIYEQLGLIDTPAPSTA